MDPYRWHRLLAGFVFGCAALLAGGAALALEPGEKAPDFALQSTTGKEIKRADFAGKQPIVLFFYIAAFTNT
jgi:cytochrome oxidase Cu insertion factor (SCO1/SenC/PrrC family)